MNFEKKSELTAENKNIYLNNPTYKNWILNLDQVFILNKSIFEKSLELKKYPVILKRKIQLVPYMQSNPERTLKWTDLYRPASQLRSTLIMTRSKQ